MAAASKGRQKFVKPGKRWWPSIFWDGTEEQEWETNLKGNLGTKWMEHRRRERVKVTFRFLLSNGRWWGLHWVVSSLEER